jgi:hypothetical protein
MAHISVAITGSAILSWHLPLCEGFAAKNINNHNKRLPHSPTALWDNDGCGGIQRRDAINNIFRGTASVAAAALIKAQSASALDFQAFESAEISKDSTPFDNKLNDDEALCKYGAPGKSMGEACARAKIDRKLPGGVDATGKVDRGDYEVCKYEYPIIDGNYVKTRVCKPSREWGSDIK